MPQHMTGFPSCIETKIIQFFGFQPKPRVSLYHLSTHPFSIIPTRRLSVTAASWQWQYRYERPPLVEATYDGRKLIWPSPFNQGLQKWPADTPVDRSCIEVRRLINRLIDGRETTVEAFCEQIGVGRSSFYAFMGQNGTWDGRRTNTFPLALHYFQQRERDGVPMPRKMASKRKHATSVVVLDGQDEDKVPVFDSCDEIRRKIKRHMRKEGVNQRTFLQDLSAQFQKTPVVIKRSDLEKFRGGRGPNSENANPVFYAAYVFFEKIRVGAKKEKPKLREEMEKIYLESGGVNVKVPSDKQGAWFGDLPPTSWVRIDKYGKAIVRLGDSGLSVEYGPPGYASPLFVMGYERRFYQYE